MDTHVNPVCGFEYADANAYSYSIAYVGLRNAVANGNAHTAPNHADVPGDVCVQPASACLHPANLHDEDGTGVLGVGGAAVSKPAPSPTERCATCGSTQDNHKLKLKKAEEENERLRERLLYISRGWHSDTCGSVLSESKVYPCNCHIGIALEALK